MFSARRVRSSIKKMWIGQGIRILSALCLLILLSAAVQPSTPTRAMLLTDPFLQLPTATSVQVVWFTEFLGDRHWVEYGIALEKQAFAATTQLSRVREDQKSRVGSQTEDAQVFTQPTARAIWRHEARVTGLTAGRRLPYRVVSQTEDGSTVISDRFSLSPLPATGTPLKILLTSDHQLMPLTPANLQKVVETVGRVDAVFVAGDLVNIPDRASEWFDDNRGGAFFPSLQGRAQYTLEKDGTQTVYRGGALIQHAPLFPAMGNHEVMGRFSSETELGAQFNDPYPKAAATRRFQDGASPDDPNGQTWLKNNTFNTDTVEELFTLPTDSPGGKRYYALTFGDVRLVVLFATNIWRTPSLDPNARGRYRERDADLEFPERWGYGQHIFEAIATDSPQYRWLQNELGSAEFQQAKYKLVMFHHPMHSLGDNIVPAYTDPVQQVETAPDGTIQSVRYEYPLEQDYLIRDVQPLLAQAGVQLVLYGHSHLWNRFVSPTGMHFLETSNVGNTYGAYWGEARRPVPLGFQERYAATGDPNGLEPVVPAIAPLIDEAGQPQPYISSNDMTVFSILETDTGTVSSYYFDTRKPDSDVVKFDAFVLRSP
jgi:Calcineurin-like phosphoesterase